MKEKLHLLIYTVLIALCGVSSGKISASDCCSPSFDPCDPCCPIRPCAFSVQAKGGYEPGYYTGRTYSWLNIPAASDYLIKGPKSAKMNKQMTGPWQIGGEVGYNLNCNFMAFLEINYFKGGKDNNSTSATLPDNTVVPFTEKFQGQNGWNGYIGGRYFFSRCWFCNKVAPFVGVKAGFTHYKTLICFPTSPDGTRLDVVRFHKSSTNVSAGIQLGFDWLICNNIHGIFTAELVATAPRKNNINDEADPTQSGGIYNSIIGDTGTIINFPLTIGLRYDF